MSNRYNLIRDFYLAQAPPSDQAITRQAFLSDTQTLSARVVNEFRASVTHSNYTRHNPGDLSQVNYTKDTFGLPNFTSWGFPKMVADMLTMGPLQDMQNNYENQYQAADDITIVIRTPQYPGRRRFPSVAAEHAVVGAVVLSGGQYNFNSANSDRLRKHHHTDRRRRLPVRQLPARRAEYDLAERRQCSLLLSLQDRGGVLPGRLEGAVRT